MSTQVWLRWRDLKVAGVVAEAVGCQRGEAIAAELSVEGVADAVELDVGGAAIAAELRAK